MVVVGPEQVTESAETASRRKAIFNAGFSAGFKNREKIVPRRWRGFYVEQHWLNGWQCGQQRRNQDL